MRPRSSRRTSGGSQRRAAATVLAAGSGRARAQLCIVQGPEAVRARYPGGCIWGSTATFAAPSFGERIRGRFHWEDRDGCDADLPLSVAPLDWRQRGSSASTSFRSSGVHGLRRGHCSFARKARGARRRGAEALVVVDFQDSGASWQDVERTVVAGDGVGDAGLVPMLLIISADVEALAASAAAGQVVVVELRWGLPRLPATLDVWLSLGDLSSLSLLRDLVPTARALGPSVHFRPHFRVVALPSDTPASVLNHRCLSSLRHFCADEAGSSERSGSAALGAMLLAEAARQHCIRFIHGTRATRGGTPDIWWAYLDWLLASCAPLVAGGSAASSEEVVNCLSLASSRRAMVAAGVNSAAVEACAGGEGLAFLEDDREAQAWGAMTSWVAVRINGWRYSGPPAATSVLRAVCRGGLPTAEAVVPAACMEFMPKREAQRGPEVPLWALVGLCTALAAASHLACRVLLWMWRRRRHLKCGKSR